MCMGVFLIQADGQLIEMSEVPCHNPSPEHSSVGVQRVGRS